MKLAAIAILALVACASFAPVQAVYEVPIPPNTNCNKSCYLVPGLLPLKKTLFKLCKIKGVKIIDATPGRFGCDTFIYHRFPDYKTMVKYQNCEHTQKLYQDKMFRFKKAPPQAPQQAAQASPQAPQAAQASPQAPQAAQASAQA